jgi:hypothetical protein
VTALSVIFKRTSSTVLRFKFLVGDLHEEYPDHGRAFIVENGFEFPLEERWKTPLRREVFEILHRPDRIPASFLP